MNRTGSPGASSSAAAGPPGAPRAAGQPASRAAVDSTCRCEPGSSYVDAREAAHRLPRPRLDPHEHTEHGVVRPDPFRVAARHDLAGSAGAPCGRADLLRRCLCASALPGGGPAAEMGARVPEVESVPDGGDRSGFPTTPSTPREVSTPVIYRRNRGNHSHSRDEIRCAEQDFRRTNSVAELVLDIGALDNGSGYLDLGLSLVSPDEHLLAYSVDTTGDEVYRLRFRDLRTGADLTTRCRAATTAERGAPTRPWFFYTVHDQAYRPHQVWRHRIGHRGHRGRAGARRSRTSGSSSTCVPVRSGDLVVILSESRTTAETWVVDAATPEQPPRSVGGRRQGVVYHAEHVRGPGGGRPAAGHRRRRGRVPAGRAPVPPAAPTRTHAGLGRGAARGPRRAARARRRVRRGRSC